MYKRGDNVRLKCGGPTMTVIAGPGDVYRRQGTDVWKCQENYVRCRWFNADGEIQEESFHVEVLQSYVLPHFRSGAQPKRMESGQ